MKIKSIAAICKKNKNIAIFERYSDDGDILTQYIGDGSAVYPVVGLPQLDKESLLTIFDVPEKDRDNYFVKTLGVPACNTKSISPSCRSPPDQARSRIRRSACRRSLAAYTSTYF